MPEASGKLRVTSAALRAAQPPLRIPGDHGTASHTFPPGKRIHVSQPFTTDCSPSQRVSAGLRTAIPGWLKTWV